MHQAVMFMLADMAKDIEAGKPVGLAGSLEG
jgi:alkylation response protein AidB-like acyl-CoA dehydrogenase